MQAVPETSVTARQLLQGSDSVGGYYGESVLTSYGYGYGSPSISGRRRQLLQGSGGYGTYGMSTGGYGYGYGRGLMEDDIVLEPSDPLLQYAEQRAADTTSTGGLSAALQQAQASSSKASRQQLSIPAGKCYCRYDTDFNTWALAEDTCKEALYQRCKVSAGPAYTPCQRPHRVCAACTSDSALAPACSPSTTSLHVMAMGVDVWCKGRFSHAGIVAGAAQCLLRSVLQE